MARQCPFLVANNKGIFSASYRCQKNDQDVLTGSELYKNYCDNYEQNYSQCPNFKPIPTSSGNCYLTSACAQAMGLADDCEELTILRRFRDTWLAKQPGGQEEIDQYYRLAPDIVRRIDQSADRLKTYRHIYREMVSPCVVLIKKNQYQAAWTLYRARTVDLQSDQ